MKSKQAIILSYLVRYRVILFALLLALNISCEKQTKWDLQTQSTNFIVVDGMITNEYKNQNIKLTYAVSNLNEPAQPVSGATVTVFNGDSTIIFNETPTGSGIYMSGNKYRGEQGITYKLKIFLGDKSFQAEATMMPNTFLKILRYKKIENSDKYQLNWVTNGYNNDHPAMYEVNLDWTNVAGYENQSPADCKATLYFYTLTTLDVSEIFAPDMEKITFPVGTHIQEKLYSLTNNHALYIRALLSETTWRGGYFDSAPANVPTNLSEGAIGYFSACSVTSVSIMVAP